MLCGQDLVAVAHCCPNLTRLNISSCRSLHPAALAILLPPTPTNPSLGSNTTQLGQPPSCSPTHSCHRGVTLSGVQDSRAQDGGLVDDQQQKKYELQDSRAQDGGLVDDQQQKYELPMLTSLDVSYCSLPAEAVCSLLQHGHRFQVSWLPSWSTLTLTQCDVLLQLVCHTLVCGANADLPLRMLCALTANRTAGSKWGCCSLCALWLSLHGV